jgi:tRNA A64-2'-O-ribosylphosphate transferase
MSEGGYIQGAGDDSEGWASGLTPAVFWENKDTLFNTPEADLPSLIDELTKQHRPESQTEHGTLIHPTGNLYIGKSDANPQATGNFDLIIDCNADPGTTDNPKCLNLGLSTGKIGGRNLRRVLDKVESFVSSHLGSHPSWSAIVTCESGKDLSVGVALAIICLFYDDQGESCILQS